MASEEAAVTMMNYYTSAPPTMRNQPIYIQYSTHRELKTDNLANQVRTSSSIPPTMKLTVSLFQVSLFHRSAEKLKLKKKVANHKK